MVPSLWDLLDLVCKFFTYLGAASLVGTLFCLWLFKNESSQLSDDLLVYMAGGAFLGFQGALLRFFVQVGMVVDDGLIGMFDWGMAEIYIDSPIGDTTFFQLCGYALAFLLAIRYRKETQGNSHKSGQASFRFFYSAGLLALFLLLFSFRFSGHISVLSVISKIAIVLHYTAFAAWIGSLYPLYLLSFSNNISFIQSRVKAFGDKAVLIVFGLVAAGAYMLFELFASIGEIFKSSYGLVVLSKLSLVIVILSIAAVNRIRLTPNLVSQNGVKLFRFSVKIEILVAICILIVTTYLSTVVGPPDH